MEKNDLTQKAIRLLIIEDNPGDTRLFKEYLKADSEVKYEISAAETLAGGMDILLHQTIDIVITDLGLPDSKGLDTSNEILQAFPKIPVIIITGLDNEKLGIESIRSGVQNYLVKINITPGSLIHSIKFSLERKKIEEALIQSEGMFRKLLNTSPEAIIRMDLRSRITAFSDVTPVILGFEKNFNLANIPLIQFLPPEGKKKMREVLKRLETEGLIHNIEVLLIKNDKSTFLGEISLAVVEESEGKPSGYIAIIRDVTSRRIMEMQMIHNARMLSLGEMAAGIAHEINQPLNIISITLENLMVEILDNDATDKTYIKTKSEKIFDNITRMRNIIDHIRSFSRDKDDLIHGMFDIHDGITNAISMMAEQFRHRVIELVLDFDKSIPPFPGDVYKFEQVILNLLTNAKDAIEEKHKTNKTPGKQFVKIVTHQDDKSIYVKVEDTGIGIKSAEIDKVLIPFFTTKETGKGTGLGLSISYGIIKEMHGTIVIDSKRNVGTTVLITLPLNPEKPAKQN